MNLLNPPSARKMPFESHSAAAGTARSVVAVMNGRAIAQPMAFRSRKVPDALSGSGSDQSRMSMRR